MTVKEQGFTLVEVLASLAIMVMIVGTAAMTLTGQARIAAQGRSQIETNHAARTAMTFIEREIRQAKVVTLPKPEVLKIIRTNNQVLYFYVDDKDGNGVMDLYQETDGVANPVVSYVNKVAFEEKNPGLWGISLTAGQNGVETSWNLSVLQRAD